MKLTYLKEKVERFENLEEKCGIEIKSISFVQTKGYITCYVEVVSTRELSRDDVSIEAILYDNEGDIINKNGRYVEFEGFGVYELNFFDIEPNEISRIRIYPTV